MSLGYELVVFTSSYKFIKFIAAWQIRNKSAFEIFKDPVPLPPERMDSRMVKMIRYSLLPHLEE